MIARLLVASAFTLFSMSAFADGKACSPDIERWFSKELPSLKSWQAIHRSFQKAPCDDGIFAEGYSDAIVVMLARHWRALPDLAALVKHDPQFEKFVLRHIDATTDPEDLKQVQTQAGSICPPKHKALCSSIGSAATLAINEL